MGRGAAAQYTFNPEFPGEKQRNTCRGAVVVAVVYFGGAHETSVVAARSLLQALERKYSAIAVVSLTIFRPRLDRQLLNRFTLCCMQKNKALVFCFPCY